MKRILNGTFLVGALLLAGCSSEPKDGVGEELKTYETEGAPKEVTQASREQRPLWSLDLRRWQEEHGKEGMHYFVGSAVSKRTQNTSTNEAKLEAFSQISDAIAAKITESITKTETSHAITDKEVTPSELFEVISRKVKKKSNNNIQGVQTADTFWWKRTNNRGEVYDAWVLLSLSSSTLEKATQNAARKTLIKDQSSLQKVISDLKETQDND